MTSLIDMSLEDIIQRNKRENRAKGVPNANETKWNNVPKQKVPIIDARNKIISKKRTQITDAREKLAELAKHKDARLKLEQLRKKRQALQGKAPTHGRKFFHGSGKLERKLPNLERVFVDPSRQVVSQPLSRSWMLSKRQMNTKKFMENRVIDNRSLAKSGSSSLNDKMPRLKPILRTVENDLDIIDDPMEEDYVAQKPSPLNRKTNLQLRIVAHNNETRDHPLRSTYSAHRLCTPEKEKSPSRPPSILKKRPMASLRAEKRPEKDDKPTPEYRIIVSNLRNSVSAGDIQELFGDVGGMIESRLVRPGTAEVIYKSVEDAQKAVDLYHNRQLDGQPMNCLLVTPRSAAAPTRNATKPALYSTNSNVEPDISTFHKVLFSDL